MSDLPSIFFDRNEIDPDEICFRAVFALGWAIDRNFPEFWSLTEDAWMGWRMHDWIDRLEKRVLHPLCAMGLNILDLPHRLREKLESEARDPVVSRRPHASEFITKVAASIDGHALDPIFQLQNLNTRGFDLARRMLMDPAWSCQEAADQWKNHPNSRKLNVRYVAVPSEAGTFIPRTEKNEILFRVMLGNFQCKNALLEYLQLEFEFMHEYVSHVLPLWQSTAKLLEDEYLLRAAHQYYWTLGRHVHRPELVDRADQLIDDYRRDRRRRIKELELLISAPRVSQIMVELALIPNETLSQEHKSQFLVRLSKTGAPYDAEFTRRFQHDRASALVRWLNGL